MSDSPLKQINQNCFMDLQRAATSFYLNPRGNTHKVFLSHAKKILNDLKNKKADSVLLKISQLEKEISVFGKDESQIRNLADKILTTGILLRI